MNTTQYENEELAVSSDKFIAHCLDNRSNNALGVFEKLGR
jgi:hypothetical protein